MIKSHRTNGAIGALLDEYEKALKELIVVITNLSQEELTIIVDYNTKDDNCRSIQTILDHVIISGYTYVIEVRKWLGENIDYRKRVNLQLSDDYIIAMEKMFAFNEQLFQDFPDIKIEEHDSKKKIKVRWGQKYDVEQLYEHAIVHILRHRRQIEKFIIIIKKETENKK